MVVVSQWWCIASYITRSNRHRSADVVPRVALGFVLAQPPIAHVGAGSCSSPACPSAALDEQTLNCIVIA